MISNFFKPALAMMLAVAGVAVVGIAGEARAQGVQDRPSATFLRGPLNPDAVASRRRPEFDAVGRRVGSFILFGTLDNEIGFDSNVFQFEDAESEFFYAIAPRLTLASNWSRHQVIVTAGNRSRFFVDLTSENTTDPDVSVQTRFDIGQRTAVRAFAGFQRSHEQRGAPEADLTSTTEGVNEGFFAERVIFDTTRAGLRFDSRINRLSYGVGIEFENRNFRDSELAGGPIEGADGFILPFPGLAPFPDGDIDALVDGVIDGVASNDDRDQNTVIANFEAGYDFSPGYAAFMRLELNGRRFLNGSVLGEDFDRTGVDRDSEGVEILGGVQFTFSNLVAGEIAAGYLRQNYDNSQPIAFSTDPDVNVQLDDIAGPTVDARVEWYPTPLITARASVERTVRDTIVAEGIIQNLGPDNEGPFAVGVGIFETNVGVGADYEFKRNVIVSGDLNFIDQQFEGTERSDEVIEAGLETIYLINRSAQARFAYNFVDRSSTDPFGAFSQHLLGLNLRLQR